MAKADGMESLVQRAAGMGDAMGEEPMDDDAAVDDDAMKEEFMAMAAAIREGDDEAAWEAYKACAGKA
jgi:hypothetical protein